MSSPTRQSLVTGPAKITYNSATCFTANDVAAKFSEQIVMIKDSAHGIAARRTEEVVVEADYQPEGRWSAAIIAAYWPYANTILGASLHGSSNVPVVMNGADGEIHTIIAAAVHKMPTITLSSTKTIVGAVTMKGVRGNAAEWSDASNLYSVAATGGSIADATYDPGLIKTQGYKATWGSIAGFSAFDTEDGFTVDFNLQVAPIGTDYYGILDYRFVSLEVMVKCKPIGPTSTQVLASLIAQGTGAKRGRDTRYQNDNATVNPDLVITGQDGIAYVTISAPGVEQAGYRFGATTLRQGEIGFVANRIFTTGVQQPLYTLAAS